MSSERTDDAGRPADQRLVDSVLERTRVSLRFVIGRAKLPTSQVMSLAVGQVIPFDGPISNRVALDLDGTVIGEGEMVEVEGRRGVRLLHMDDSVR